MRTLTTPLAAVVLQAVSAGPLVTVLAAPPAQQAAQPEAQAAKPEAPAIQNRLKRIQGIAKTKVPVDLTVKNLAIGVSAQMTVSSASSSDRIRSVR